MPQSKLQSFIEAITNTAIGFVISLTATFIIFPLVGVATTPFKNVLITLFFTVISILRGYVIRRYFNKKAKTPLTYPNKTPFLLHCFQCEFETPVMRVGQRLFCSSCGTKHINTY